MPLSPSISAVAGPCSTTRISGRTLMWPRCNVRTYPGRRKTPCASDPDRSASSIAPAVTAASPAGSPQTEKASRMKAWIAAAGTRCEAAEVSGISMDQHQWVSISGSGFGNGDLERERVDAFVTARRNDEGVPEKDAKHSV